jgi:uncharacterized protein involved in type VI secretion and phage assembly
MTDTINPQPIGSLPQNGNGDATSPRWYGAYPAIVTDIKDPDGQGRVKIALPWAPDPSGARFEAWARIATLMAGDNRGTWFIPDVDDEVLVVFQGGEPSFPFVIGAMWNGKDMPPASIDGGGHNSLKLIRTRGGITITIDDSKGFEHFSVEIPGNRKLVLSNTPESFLVKDDNGNSIHMSNKGVKITAGGTFEIECQSAVITAGELTVNAGASNFAGKIKADTIEANNFIGQSYVNGAGNIW